MTLQEEYVELLKSEREIKEKIQNHLDKIRNDFVSKCPIYVIPVDMEPNWYNDLRGIINFTWNGKPSVCTEVPSIMNGYNRKPVKAGTKCIILASWKTNKNTKGTHYILCHPKTKRVCHIYA